MTDPVYGEDKDKIAENVRETEEEPPQPEIKRTVRWDCEMESGLSEEKLRDLCNKLGHGGKPKTDILIERNDSVWPGMTKYIFRYNAPPVDRTRRL